MLEYRQEQKYICTQRQIEILKARLSPVMHVDEHQNGACYRVRSLYFDDPKNSAFNDNDAGLDCRRKFRLRVYDHPTERIHLEIKDKQHGGTKKDSSPISRDQYEKILHGERIPWNSNDPNAFRLLCKEMFSSALSPQIIVEYERSAYVCPVGNVRITFDRNIAYSNRICNFLDESIPLVPILPEGLHLVEVKYDELIPDYLLQLLQLNELSWTTFSKFYLACLARKGEYIW